MAIGHVFDESMIQILALYIDFEDENTYMSFKSWFGDIEDVGGSWIRFGILFLIWIWALIFDTPFFQILALYIDFEGAKNIHVP